MAAASVVAKNASRNETPNGNETTGQEKPNDKSNSATRERAGLHTASSHVLHVLHVLPANGLRFSPRPLLGILLSLRPGFTRKTLIAGIAE